MFSGCEKPEPIKETRAQVKPADAPAALPGEDILPPQSEPPVATTEETPATVDDKTPEELKPTVRTLFDGKSLDNWARSNFGGEGEVAVEDGVIVMQRGSEITGIHWTGDPLPKINYEVSLEAQRIDGSDFFCGIIFPVKDSFCSFVAGGWGGSLVGLSSVDEMYAADNETGTYMKFDDKTWYKIRLRVSEHAITAWIDGKELVNLKTKGRKLSLHPAVEPGKPFGITCFATVAGVKDIQVRDLSPEEIAADAAEENTN